MRVLEGESTEANFRGGGLIRADAPNESFERPE